jgi:multidrug efflux pump subunit AcrB
MQWTNLIGDLRCCVPKFDRVEEDVMRPKSSIPAGFCFFASLFASIWIAAAEEPVIVVTANYPGANAETVAATIAAPIEQQVNGVENGLSLRSRSDRDGRYSLRVRFTKSANLHQARLLVANRVALALPMLPDAAVKAGVTTRIETPVARFVVLRSSDTRHDSCYLGNLASLKVASKLAQVADVGEVATIGVGELRLRIDPDLEKLSARALTVVAVIGKLKPQLASLGKRIDDLKPEDLGNIVLKKSPDGAVTRLSDVARVELGTGAPRSFVDLDGQPAILLVLRPTPGVEPAKFSEDLRRNLAEIESQLPEGVSLDTFYRSTDASGKQSDTEYLFLEAAFPAAASPERISISLQRFAAGLHAIPGVKSTLVLSESPLPPFRDGPCVILRLSTSTARDRRQVVERVAEQIQQVRDFAVTYCDLSPPVGDAPSLDMAVVGQEAPDVRRSAEMLADRLHKGKEIADVSAELPASEPLLSIEIDRERAAGQGVSLAEATTMLEAYASGVELGRMKIRGQDIPVTLELSPKEVRELDIRGRNVRVWDGTVSVRNPESAVAGMKVFTVDGHPVPFRQIARVTSTYALPHIDRLDMYPMVRLRVNLARGASPAAAWSTCKAAAATELGKTCRLVWLSAEPEPNE